MNVFNISLDDACPKKECNPFPEVIFWCNKLIEKYPNIKIDFFTSAAYCRLGEDPYFLTNYLDWVKQANELPQKNYRFNAHSYFHRRISVKFGNSNNNEVEKTSEQETKILIQHMIGEFNRSNFKYEKVFRAPGFHIGIAAAKVLTDFGFIIAGNEKYYNLLKDVPKLKYLVYNWDMNDDCNLNKDIFAVGHTSNWTSNYFNEKIYNRVLKVLESREFEFKFLSEVEWQEI